MKSIILSQSGKPTGILIPETISVRRFAFAVNLLVVVESNPPVLQLIDVDPINWKTWFPYFLSNVGSFDHVQRDVLSILSAISKAESALGGRRLLMSAAVGEYQRIFALNGPLELRDFPTHDIVSLKFSKSQEEWTVYKNIFALTVVSKTVYSVLKQTECIQDFLPLDNSLQQTLATAIFRGKEIVDNVLTLLKDGTIISAINHK